MSRILIADYVHQKLVTELRVRGNMVTYAPEIQLPQVVKWLPSYEGIIVNTKTPIREALLSSNPQLKFIGRLGVGLDIIDVSVAEDRGVAVVNTPGANANAVAEHCVGMLLALLRNIPRANGEVKAGHWNREKNRGVELGQLTIGIIGFGNTGSAFAGKFGGWKTRIVSFDKYKKHYADHLRFVEETSLERVMAESDVISLHVPLTEETLHMVNSAFLGRCKRGVILINSARGKVIDTQAVLDALNSGQVGGACLDVLEVEAPEKRNENDQELYSELFAMDNVICSPHIAGWTWTSKYNIARQMLDQLKALDVI